MDIPIAKVLIDAINYRLDCVNLVWEHHYELLFASDEHHVLTDHLIERAFRKETVGKIVEVSNLSVVLCRELINGQESFVSVEGEVARIIVREVPSVSAIADYKSWIKQRSVFVYPEPGSFL